MNIIGLGNCGCNMAQEFEKYSQYEVFCIDTEARQAKNFYFMPTMSHPEHYEKNCPDLTNFLNVNGATIFILSGAGLISAACLRILEKIKHCKTTILYVRSDQELLSETQRLQQRATFHILQEYARSGVFEQMILVDNVSVSEIVGEVSIVDYHRTINQTIVPIVHFINVFDNSQPIMSTFYPFADTSRIRALSMVNVETGEEKMLFSLDNVTESRYYYAIGGESLREDATLNNKIRNQTREKNGKTSFGVFETSYDSNFCYGLVCSRQTAEF